MPVELSKRMVPAYDFLLMYQAKLGSEAAAQSGKICAKYRGQNGSECAARLITGLGAGLTLASNIRGLRLRVAVRPWIPCSAEESGRATASTHRRVHACSEAELCPTAVAEKTQRVEKSRRWPR